MKKCIFCQGESDSGRELKVDGESYFVCEVCEEFLNIIDVVKSQAGDGITFKLKCPVETLNKKGIRLYNEFLNTISARKRAYVQKELESGKAYLVRRKKD